MTRFLEEATYLIGGEHFTVAASYCEGVSQRGT